MYDQSNGRSTESFFKNLDATNIMSVKLDKPLGSEKVVPTKHPRRALHQITMQRCCIVVMP